MDAIESGMGMGAEILSKLLRKAKKKGLPSGSVHLLSTDAGDVLLDKYIDLLVDAVNGPKSIISVGSTFTRDMRSERWTLLEDTLVCGAESFNVAALETVSFLRDGERTINGEEMKNRAKDRGASLGQRHAEARLANQHLIPTEFRQYYLVFTGTVWQNRVGYRRVPYLGWGGDRWYLRFRWLDDDFSSHDRLLRSRR